MMRATLPFLFFFVALAFTTSSAVLAEGRAPEGDDTRKGAPPNGAKDGSKSKKEDPSQCVTHTEQARFVSGYDHLVHIKNGCSERVTCDVSTNVNPRKQSVRVSPGKMETVLTFRGSPAREFRATVKCQFTNSTR